jgi:general secretion pathway protein G
LAVSVVVSYSGLVSRTGFEEQGMPEADHPPVPSRSRVSYPSPKRRTARVVVRGFTLIEMMISVVIIGILASIAIPNYSGLRERAFVARAIGDLKALQQDISEYTYTHGALPASLAEIGRANFPDPWGNPYQYLPITGNGKGGFRKDRFLVPINSDFDLYSMGPDGVSTAPLTAKASRDDIIRANDGGFVGRASDF